MPELDPSHPSYQEDILATLPYRAGLPSCHATIKTRSEDFQVTENLGFQPTGSGEHLLLYVRKQNLTTLESVQRLSECTGIRRREIGYCGMKDKYGDCRQWFSLPLAATAETSLQALEGKGLSIEDQQRNQRKLHIGSHRSNVFRIRLREIDGSREEIESRLEECAEQGVPNYFGGQRFGKRLGDLQQVGALIDTEQAARMKRRDRSMLYSAARSLLFNQVLAQRLRSGNWYRYVDGDVLNLDGTDRYFVLESGAAWDDELQGRLERMDIHISGPLSGAVEAKDRYVPRGEAADIELAILQQFAGVGLWLEAQGLRASRRSLRFRPRDLGWEWESESELVLQFELHRGCYATSLLREICRVRDGSPRSQQESSKES